MAELRHQVGRVIGAHQIYDQRERLRHVVRQPACRAAISRSMLTRAKSFCAMALRRIVGSRRVRTGRMLQEFFLRAIRLASLLAARNP